MPAPRLDDTMPAESTGRRSRCGSSPRHNAVMLRTLRPGPGDALPAHAVYVDQVPDGDILTILQSQGREALALLRGITEEQSLHRYAPGKWSLRELLNHVNDAERVFALRALWFARGYGESLPGFEQDTGVAHAAADRRPWQAHVDEFQHLRAATVSLVENLPEEAWDRRGIASDAPVSVRGMIFVCAGHVAHHVRILRERYL